MKRLLLEFPWLRLHQVITLPTNTGGEAEINTLDIRLEEMIKDGFVSRKAAAGWYAQLPHSDMFLHDDGSISDSPGDGIQLPDGWWEYSYGVLGDHNTKASVKPRREQNELSQAEIDAGARVYAESLERRLSLVLDRPW